MSGELNQSSRWPRSRTNWRADPGGQERKAQPVHGRARPTLPRHLGEHELREDDGERVDREVDVEDPPPAPAVAERSEEHQGN